MVLRKKLEDGRREYLILMEGEAETQVEESYEAELLSIDSPGWLTR